MEGGGLHAEGEFLFLSIWLVSRTKCRGQLENRVLETALVSLCSTRENHEGGEYEIIILATVKADVMSTTQHRHNSGRFWLLDFILDGYFRFSICENRGLVST